MAISDQQIFDWLVANPTADDATIAAIMDQFDVTPADVARATGTDVADIQSRYEAVTETPTAPTVIETPTTGGLNAVSVASEPTYTSYETESGTVYEPVYEPPPPPPEEPPVYEPPRPPVIEEPPEPPPPPTPPPTPEKPIVEPIVEPPKPPVKEIVETNVPQDKTVTQTTTETKLPTITDYQGNQYDGTQVLTLARQLAENAGTMTGGAFKTKGESIGFDASQASNLLGRTATASEQVLLDMARQMIQSGVTDLTQLKTQDITSSANVGVDPDTGQYYALIPSGDGETSTRKDLTPEQVAKIRTEEVMGSGDEGTYVRRTIDDLVTGKGLFANGKMLTAQDALDNPIAYTIGQTYTGGGGTNYELKFDPKTGKSIVSANGFTTSDADTIMPVIMIASNFLLPGVGSALTSTLIEAGMSEFASQIVSKAVLNGVTSGVMAEASGGSFGDGFLKGSVTGAISAGVAPMISTALPSDLSPAVSNALTRAGTAAITALATGTDVGTAVGTQLLNSAVNTGLGSVTGEMGLSTADAKLLNSVLTPVITQLATNGNVSDATLMNAVLLAGSTVLANTGSDAVNTVSTLTTGSDADKTVGGLNLLANNSGNETITDLASTVNTGLGLASTATGLLNKATSLTKPVTKVDKTKANLTGALRTTKPITKTAAVKPAALGALNTAKKTLSAQQMSQLKASKPAARVNVANLTPIKKSAPPQRVDVKTLIPVKKAQLPAGLNTKKMG